MAYISQSSYHRVWKRAFDVLISVPLCLLVSPVLLGFGLLRLLGVMPALPLMLVGRELRTYRTYRAEWGLLRHSLRVWDVVLGRASLVGPRLLSVAELDPSAIALRAAVTPGLTCLHWLRVRSNVAFTEEYLSDREYAQRSSFSADISILARSLLVSVYGSPACAAERQVEIMGVRIDNLSMSEALESIERAVDEVTPPAQIAFVNADCLNRATGDAAYRDALQSTGLVLADGIGLKIAGSMLARPIRQNVNGTDLFPLLCARLQEKGSRLFLLGARPEVVEALAQRVRQQYPGIVLCGVRDGFFIDEEAVVRDISAAAPDVLLVALGAPLQDVFIARNRHRLGAKVCIGVGGLFDFYSGRIPRAPQWLRDAGLEWTYRLYQEPGRMWKRYLVGNILFLMRVTAEKFGHSYHADTTAVIR